MENIYCEHLIIGSGPGASVIAESLSQKSNDIYLIERGGKYNLKKIGDGIRLQYTFGGIFPFFSKSIISYGEASTYGGGSKINGGLIWRTPEFILKEWLDKGILDKEFLKTIVSKFSKIEKKLEVSYHRQHDNFDSKILSNAAEDLNWKIVDVPRAGGSDCNNLNRCPIGCPDKNKKSVDLNYLKDAEKNGLNIKLDTSLDKLVKKGDTIKYAIVSEGEKKIRIFAKKFWLCAGNIHTNHILRKNNLIPKKFNKFYFHINFKFIANFDSDIRATKSTMFTKQVQEFINENILIMGTNHTKNLAATSLSDFDNDIINDVVGNINNHGSYVCQVRPQRSYGIINSLFGQPFVRYVHLDKDSELIKKSFFYTCKLLFNAGAKKIYLPLKFSKPITSLSDIDCIKIKLKDLKMVSVHSMGSCPISNDHSKKVVNYDGRLDSIKNLYIADSSLIPSNIGESPQGTVMAFAHSIVENYIK